MTIRTHIPKDVLGSNFIATFTEGKLTEVETLEGEPALYLFGRCERQLLLDYCASISLIPLAH